MSNAVFIHNPSSKYDDDPSLHYHFPKMYLKRAKETVGDWIVYYESGKNKGRKSYKALARVAQIRPDLNKPNHYYADMVPGSYLPMERDVPFKLDGDLFESKLQSEDGGVNGGYAIQAIRLLPAADFRKIVEYGIPDEQEDLPRVDEVSKTPIQPEFAEDRATFEFGEAHAQPREVEAVLTNRKRRDRAFRSAVLRAYGKTCAFTGMSFINGGGRAEVQAAHIRPVEHDGPDIVTNGLALSGTAHWMFDRGLLSLSDEGQILVSRHINNIEEANRLLVKDKRARLPKLKSDCPHPAYLYWHRENCFKQ